MIKRLFLFFLVLSMVGLAIFFAVNFYQEIKYPLFYEEDILLASSEFGIEPYIIASMINVESSFHPTAISNKGAVGLMQLLPSTAQWLATKIGYANYSQEDLLSPQINILLGTYYLSYLGSRFANQTAVFCAYNAGEGIVRGWLENQEYSSDGISLKTIPFPETQNYIAKLQNNMRIYYDKFN